MKCLVVAAHPLPQSLCVSIASHVMDTLRARGHEVQLLDLYREGFEGSLTVRERKTYYGSSYDASAVATEVAQVLDAEAIVFVFPTWWFGFPAILNVPAVGVGSCYTCWVSGPDGRGAS